MELDRKVYDELCDQIRHVVTSQKFIAKKQRLIISLIQMLLEELEKARDEDYIIHVQPLETLIGKLKLEKENG